MGLDEIESNLLFCVLLAAVGGVMEVVATAVLAYPAAQMLQGIQWSERGIKLTLALNLFFQIAASIAGNLCSTWFGPISIAGPVFFAAQLVANLVIFWLVLGLECFTKEMQVGTYVIVVAVTLLLRVGPGEPDMQDFEELITKPWAFTWAIILLAGMLLTTIPLIPNFIDICRLSTCKRFFILLTVRATAFSINLTTGRAVILEASRFWILTSIVIKVISGAIYTRAIVVQSTSVEQAKFVPLNAVVTLLTVAITGIIIWEDYMYIVDRIGYVCVFLLFGLGCFLLLGDIQLLSEKDPKAFRATYALARPKGRRHRLQSIKAYSISSARIDKMDVDGEEDEFCDLPVIGNEKSVSITDRSISVPERHSIRSQSLDRKSAWKSIYGRGDFECQSDSEVVGGALKPINESERPSVWSSRMKDSKMTNCREQRETDLSDSQHATQP